MRPIRFRVWDEKYNCWDTSHNFYFYANSPLISQGRIFQQYTGFTDRNGKDVYEGDIFRSEGAYKWAAVEFMDGKFVVALMGARVYDLCELFEVDYDKPEVIGNIFENAELLK
jgi:hypothetical protein